MPFELWGATEPFGISRPDHPLEALLLLLYVVLLIYLTYRYRERLLKLGRARLVQLVGLVILSFLTSQLFPINISGRLVPVPPDAAEYSVLTALAAAPFLFAGATMGPAAALIVGLASGLGRAFGQSHSLFDPVHFAFGATLAAQAMQQKYRGRIYDGLRQPVVSGALSNVCVVFLAGIAAFFGTRPDVSYLAGLDVALSAMGVSFWPLLIEGVVGGLIVSLVLTRRRGIRLHRSLVPSPQQRSLRKRLLGSFSLFAFFAVVLLTAVVFLLSLNVSTRLIVNQMANNARAVSSQVPVFQRQLEGVLEQYSRNESLLDASSAEAEAILAELLDGGLFFQSLLLVDLQGNAKASYPDEDAPALSELEQLALARLVETGETGMASAKTRQQVLVLTFVTPVLDDAGAPAAALVGRVPDFSLNNLVIGLQDAVGRGGGFIVNPDGEIIARSDGVPANGDWMPLDPLSRRDMYVDPELEGVAYLGREDSELTRELVYYVSSNAHDWTVVTKVPYTVVLNLALGIGGPLMLVLLAVMGMFYANLTAFSRDITQPIVELAKASKTIAAGGSYPITIHQGRNDEVAQLGRAFTHMQSVLNQRLADLSLLLSVSDEISKRIDIGEGIPVILAGALEGTEARGARAVVVNPSGGYPLTYGEGEAAGAMAVLDRPIMARLRQGGELLLSNPDALHKELSLTAGVKPPVRALIALPLRSHDRFQGILWLGYRQPHHFESAERNLLHTLASQASVLVDKVRLFATAEGGRRRLAAVLASTSNGVIVTDRTERVLLVNRALERTFGIKASEVIGRPVADVIPVRELLEALTGGEERAPNREIAMADGKIFYTTASTIVNNDGQVLGRVAVLNDVTHFKEVDEMKSEFVATVSHDLRSPLTFMRGYTTMLPMVGDINEKQQEYVDKILSGIEQMANLVDDLLDLSRIDNAELKFRHVDVQTLLEELAEEFWQHAHYQGIKIEVDPPTNVAPIRADEMFIRQAISNLINNGIKYAPHSGKMRLRAEQMNGEVVISVHDQGPGIPKQAQLRLFERFYRVKRRGTEKVKGSGLGLAIVKSVAERHGGRAWCSSQSGKGSSFFISIPVWREDAPITQLEQSVQQ